MKKHHQCVFPTPIQRARRNRALMLQDQKNIPVNYYTFGFFVQELNRYIAELEHPRYLTFVTGGISVDGGMTFTVYIGDRFNPERWIDSIEFTFPKSGGITRIVPPTVKSFGGIVPTEPRKLATIVPVPTIEETFGQPVATKTVNRSSGVNRRTGYKVTRYRYSTYTEYINFVSKLFDELKDVTPCLNKSLIGAFLGNFAYPECFESNGQMHRQHLKLKSDIELNDEVKSKFTIDWDYFINHWEDNAIPLAGYKSPDYQRVYKSSHKCIDLVENFIGNKTYILTPFGKLLWEKVRDMLGLMQEDDIPEDPNPATEEEEDGAVNELPAEPEAPAEEEPAVDEEVQPAPVVKEEEQPKIRHMGYSKCNGCCYFDQHSKWCNKRLGFIESLEHDECYETKKPELEVAPTEEVEKICFNCKRWHSGNNPGNLKAIACRCPIMGKKTLTDHTCNKFVAIVKKEN